MVSAKTIRRGSAVPNSNGDTGFFQTPEQYEKRSSTHSVTYEAYRPDQTQQIARTIAAKWSGRQLPDLICTFLTGTCSRAQPAFPTIQHRTYFQHGIGSLIKSLPGSIFICDRTRPSSAVDLLQSVFIECRVFERHAGSAGHKELTEVRQGQLLVELDEYKHPTMISGSSYTQVVVVESSGPEESLRFMTDMEKSIWTELCDKYADLAARREVKASPVGSVVIVVQGTLEELVALPSFAKNAVAIVLVAGSGGMASVLAKGHELKQTADDDEVAQLLRDHVKAQYPMIADDDEQVSLVVRRHMDVLDSDRFMNQAVVVDSSHPEDLARLDQLIVQAVIRDSSYAPEDFVFHANLQMAIKCNNASIARQMIFQNPIWTDFTKMFILYRTHLTTSVEQQAGAPEFSNVEDLQSYIKQVGWNNMELALALQRSEFVDMFFDDGFRVCKHLTPTKLARLLQYGFVGHAHSFWMHVWNQGLGRSDTDPLDEQFVVDHLNPFIHRLSGIPDFLDFAEMSAHAYNHNPAGTEMDGERKARNALMVYAILNNSENLVMILIKHAQDPIPAALFAEGLFRGLGRICNEKATKAQFVATANRLSKTAYELYDISCQDNRNRSRALLLRDLPDYGNMNTLRLAVESRDKLFIGHPNIQHFLTHWYYGFISIEGSMNMLKLILSAILIFPMFKWLSFPKLEKTLADSDDLRKRRQSNVLSTAKYRSEINNKTAMLPSRPRRLEERQAYISDLSIKVHEKGARSERSRPQRTTIPLSKRIYAIWNSPCVKFFTSSGIYYAFLILISVDIMLPPCRFVGVDIAVWTWIALRWMSIITKEIYGRQNSFLSSPWIFYLELIVEGVFCILIFLYRIFPYRYDHPFAGRVILGFAVFYYAYRVWDIFYAMDPIIGPSIRLVYRSFTIDVLQWALVAYPAFFAVGLVWQATVYPDDPMNGDEWRRTLYRALGTIFGFGDYGVLEYNAYSTGQCPAAKIDWSNVTQPLRLPNIAFPPERCWIGDYTDSSCNTVTFWSYAFYLHYYVFLMLGTQLVLGCAIFTRFIDEWADNAFIWKFTFARLVLDYGVRSSLPPPLNVLGYLLNIIRYCLKQKSQSKVGSVKNMIEMESASQAYMSSTSISSYWSTVAVRYFLNKDIDNSTESRLAEMDSMADEIRREVDTFAHILKHKRLQLLQDYRSPMSTSTSI